MRSQIPELQVFFGLESVAVFLVWRCLDHFSGGPKSSSCVPGLPVFWANTLSTGSEVSDGRRARLLLVRFPFAFQPPRKSNFQ